ncbi:MAG: hypothetical protein PHU53_05640, partial [Thermoplasmata archaeon]|nr:hypothetical protein [Thermoplasmata archaeon]
MKSKIMAVWMVAVLVFSSAFVMFGNGTKAEDVGNVTWAIHTDGTLVNGTFGGGDGSIGDPYVIEDVYDLQAISSGVSKHYILGNDIDASATAGWNGGEGFIPINSFSGSLNGAYHCIDGLTIATSTDDAGLFSSMVSSSKVGNLTLTNCQISSIMFGGYAGGLAAVSLGSHITNCGVSGSVSGNMRAGGFMAFADADTAITNCYSSAQVTCPGNPAGGFVADTWGTMDRCYSTGAVTGDRVGGFVSTNAGTIANCYSTCSASGTFEVGGFVGMNDGSFIGTINNCYSTGLVTGIGTGGFAGVIAGGSITNCFWDTQTSGQATSP